MIKLGCVNLLNSFVEAFRKILVTARVVGAGRPMPKHEPFTDYLYDTISVAYMNIIEEMKANEMRLDIEGLYSYIEYHSVKNHQFDFVLSKKGLCMGDFFMGFCSISARNFERINSINPDHVNSLLRVAVELVASDMNRAVFNSIEESNGWSVGVESVIHQQVKGIIAPLINE